MTPIIFIVGPTATGKTQVSYLLARQLKGEIVSSDSMLVYKQANIITSKPSAQILKEVPHYFVDIISVEDSYSVFEYYQLATEQIHNLIERAVPVIVCGGSGLYIKALLDGVFKGVGKDKDLRQHLKAKADKYGSRHLFAELEKVDAETAQKISPNDLKRIIRALEVYHLSGRPLSEKKKEAAGLYGKLPIRIFGLRLNRNSLYEKINRRVEEMFAEGAVNEVEKLLELDLSITAKKIIGVKEIEAFLRNDCSLEKAKEIMKKNTRRFAKRQITWFKADKRIEWIDIDGLMPDRIKEIILKKLSDEE